MNLQSMGRVPGLRVPVLNVQILDSWQFEVQVQIQDFEVPVPGKLVNLVFQFFFDETTPNCSKAPLRWWELLAFKFWPSYFRATAVFLLLMFKHDAMPRTTVSYSPGCEISETANFCACPSPKMTGLFLIYKGIPAQNHSTYGYIVPTTLYFESGSSWQICRDHLVTNWIRNTC